MITINRNDLVNTLRTGVVDLIFHKLDGTMRKMRATLNPAVLPPLKGSNKRQSETALPIFDVELKQWRSVRLDSIVMIAKF